MIGFSHWMGPLQLQEPYKSNMPERQSWQQINMETQDQNFTEQMKILQGRTHNRIWIALDHNQNRQNILSST